MKLGFLSIITFTPLGFELNKFLLENSQIKTIQQVF